MTTLQKSRVVPRAEVVADHRLRVIVVHPEPLVVIGLRSILSQANVLGEGVDESAGLQLIQRCSAPHLVILGCQLQSLREATRRANLSTLELCCHRPIEDGDPSRFVLSQESSVAELLAHIYARGLGKRLMSPCPEDGAQESVTRLRRGAARWRPALEERGEHYQELTQREWEVLELVSAGCTNKEIAGRLRIRATTVKTHVSTILAKLQVSRRSHAAALFTHDYPLTS